jgi:hypothetical protein
MAITNGYATLAQVKASLRITDTVDDALIELAIEAASRDIDATCGRVFYDMGTQSRFFSAGDPYYVAIDDFQSITKVATAQTSNGNYDTVWANPTTGQNNGDWQAETLNAQYPTDGIQSPITGIRALWRYLFPTLEGKALVKITGTWGWATVPTAITQACVIQAARLFKRNDSPMAVMGMGDMGIIRVGRIDPDLERLIGHYIKTNGVA